MGVIVPDPVETYLAGLNRLGDEALSRIATEGASEDLPLIDAEVGALLHVLALTAGARRALEIGTAIGYSGTWIARALPADGSLVTFELDAGRAARAKANFARAGVAERSHVMVGDAKVLINKVHGPFDLIFQDGDKAQYGPLLDGLIERLRPGGLLVTDNVLWSGEVVPGFARRPASPTSDGAAIQAYNARLAREPRLKTVWLPLRDGVAVSVRVQPEPLS